MKLMMITSDARLARAAVDAGVDRIFVDLEINGKFERQGHRDTVISKHSFADVETVRKAVPDSTLLVRLNPWHDGSEAEAEQAIALGADLLMLPMFRSVDEVASLCETVAGRAGVIPLIETPEAVAIADEVARLDSVAELYIGLNDLHMALHKTFMFELLADGTVDRLGAQAKAAGKPFGFGGVARIGEGMLPAEKILAEHVRLGSSSVILSRTFHRNDELTVLGIHGMLSQEVRKIRATLSELQACNQERLAVISAEVKNLVEQVVVMIERGEQTL